MSTPENIGGLLFRHTRNELSRKEKEELSAWRNESSGNEQLFQTETNPEQIQKRISRVYEDRDYVFQKLKEKFPQFNPGKMKKPRTRLFYITRIAASILVLGVGLYLISEWQSLGSAGTFKASLVSSDGVIHALSDIQRGFNIGVSGIKIEKNEKDELVYVVPNDLHAGKDIYNKVFTPSGGEFIVKLPDGSLIRLNAASSLRYPLNFSSDSIRLEVQGEAYLEIAQNTKHNFTIVLDSAIIAHPSSPKTVLLKTSRGKFNIENYHEVLIDYNAGITLLEGTAKVEIDSTGGIEIANDSLLYPGDMARFFNWRIRVLTDASVKQTFAWTHGLTLIHKTDIQTIMREISRWYDVEVVYEGTMPDKKYSLNFPRDAKLQDLISSLKDQGAHVSFFLNKVTVIP